MKYFMIITAFSFFLNANSLGMVDDIARAGKAGSLVATHMDDATTILKAAKLSKVTYAALKINKMEKNIEALLRMAAKEHRLKRYSDQFTYFSKFKKFKNGDILLLKCLKNSACDLDVYSDLMTKSPLHVKVATKYPHMSLGQINIKVGTINENMMNRYFQSTGWTKIEGEVGRNGIDGLFIKRKNGVIRDVFIVESKYNKSGLQYTDNGQQMTKQWIMAKVKKLQAKYPDNPDYKVIEKYIEKDIYRAALWNLKTTDDTLIVSLKQVHDKSGKILTSDFKGGEKMKINYKGNQEIDIKYPKNDFHKKIVDWYKEEI